MRRPQEKRLAIGGPRNGEFEVIYENDELLRVPVLSDDLRVVPPLVAAAPVKFDVCEYRKMPFYVGDKEPVSVWAEKGLTARDVMERLIQGYAELQDIRKTSSWQSAR